MNVMATLRSTVFYFEHADRESLVRRKRCGHNAGLRKEKTGSPHWISPDCDGAFEVTVR